MTQRILLPILLIILNLHLAYGTAQEVIAGLVLDSGDNTPLVGVSVYIKNQETIGTVTAFDGSFSMTVPADTSRLVFSYTGYQSQVLMASACQNGPILLNPSASMLDEVIVIGYGTQPRAEITGSLSKLSAEEIQRTPSGSFESAMQGLIPGVMVNNESGKVGFNIDVNIRGIASINASQQPLYIIDGTVLNSNESLSYDNPRVNPLANIPRSDIASIEILKDASAGAIYGARASNGVVIITTKSGANEDFKIEIDANYGWSGPTKKRNFLNAEQYLELWDEAFANVADDDGLLDGRSAHQWKDQHLSGWRDGHDTQWEELMYDPDAGQRNLQARLSGGNGKTRFFISGGYSDQNAIIILNDFKRWNGRVNLDHTSSEKLDFGIKMSLARTVLTEVPVDVDFASPGGLTALSPVQPLYDPDNPDEIFPSTFYFHARSYLDNVDWKTRDTRSLSNAFLNWHPHQNFTVHVDFGLDLYESNNQRFYNSKVARNTREPGGVKRTWDTEALGYTVNSYIQYHRTSQGHHLKATAGMSFQESQERGLAIFGRNFPNDDFQNIASAGEIFFGNELETNYTVLSYLGRIQYHWEQKYLLSLSTRIDGDSRFGRDNRYGIFPGISGGWVLTKEEWLAQHRFIHFLKLRASWGLTGNAPLEHFPGLGLFEGRGYADLPGIIATQIPNPNLKWESTRQINLGLDFGIFQDRVSGSIDYYAKATRDLLLQINIPATTGFSRQLQNLGRMENKGIEVSLISNNLTGPFKWKTQLNCATNTNKVIDLQGQVIEVTGNVEIINRVVEGHPIGVFFAPEFAGVDPANGDELYYLNRENATGQLDRSTTNMIAEAHNVVIGDPNPDFIYGFTNTFHWKNIDLSIFLQGVYGNEIYNSAGRFQMDGFGWFDNQEAVMLNRWQRPGDQTDIPQVRFLQPSFASSRFISSGSYLRLKNVRLGYQLDSRLIKQLGFRDLQFYVIGQNLMTWTNFAFGDPEVNTDVTDFGENAAISRGITFFTPPQARSFLVGIKASF